MGLYQILFAAILQQINETRLYITLQGGFSFSVWKYIFCSGEGGAAVYNSGLTACLWGQILVTALLQSGMGLGNCPVGIGVGLPGSGGWRMGVFPGCREPLCLPVKVLATTQGRVLSFWREQWKKGSCKCIASSSRKEERKSCKRGWGPEWSVREQFIRTDLLPLSDFSITPLIWLVISMYTKYFHRVMVGIIERKGAAKMPTNMHLHKFFHCKCLCSQLWKPFVTWETWDQETETI